MDTRNYQQPRNAPLTMKPLDATHRRSKVRLRRDACPALTTLAAIIVGIASETSGGDVLACGIEAGTLPPIDVHPTC